MTFQDDDDQDNFYLPTTVEHARDELDGAHMEGDALPMPLDSSTSQLFHSEDPNVLFGILEDAIPKQQQSQQSQNRSFDGLDEQQQRDLLDVTYERIRRWMWSSTLANRHAAIHVRGANNATPLHLLCKLHNPPADIVQALVEAAPEICSWTDAQGWLPLHHACAVGASPEVMNTLIQAFPEGKLQPDHQQRTPLHFYATRNTDNVVTMTVNTELLSDTGAAALRDAGGMMPMHYACAYGTHAAVLQVLAAVYPASLTAVENHGRTPMHLAMVNAHRDASPGVIQFLLNQSIQSQQTINSRDYDGYLPLHLMVLGLKGYKPEDRDKRAHVSECLELYLAAEPAAAATDFLTAIQDLPGWLQDTAVVSKHVRNILNEKIVQRFPTSILMLDGMFLFALIVCFAFTTQQHINLRLGSDEFLEEHNQTRDTAGMLLFLYVGAGYFVMRELMQMASLMSLNSLAKYFGDPSTWMDMTVIILVLYYAVAMSVSDYDTIAPDNQDYLNEFRTGVAVTQGILWAAIIVFLKSTLVDFAVFVGGLFNVAQRLVAFLIAVSTILLAFAQMFYFVYLDTEICVAPNLTLAFEPASNSTEYFDPDLVGCSFPHCQFGSSLLKVYTMMMGEIGDETRYSTNLTAQILFVGYAFLVVILLSNVLIAIVTDSYEIIQNDRAAIVFWSNRLDFVAETDAIAYAIQRRLRPSHLKNLANVGVGPREQQETSGGDIFSRNGEPIENDTMLKRKTSYFRDGWHQIMLLFDENVFDDVDLVETWVYNIFRVFCIFIIIPLWLTAGLITAGWLWPPQVREYLFAQTETVISRSELERKKLEKLKNIQTNLKSMKQEVTKEMASDRIDMARMKAEVDTIQNEVLVELMQLKELMGSLIM